MSPTFQLKGCYDHRSACRHSNTGKTSFLDHEVTFEINQVLNLDDFSWSIWLAFGSNDRTSELHTAAIELLMKSTLSFVQLPSNMTSSSIFSTSFTLTAKIK